MNLWFQHEKLVDYRNDGTISGVVEAFETKKRTFGLNRKKVEELTVLLGKLHQEYNDLYVNEPDTRTRELLREGRERYAEYLRKCEFVLEHWKHFSVA